MLVTALAAIFLGVRFSAGPAWRRPFRGERCAGRSSDVRRHAFLAVFVSRRVMKISKRLGIVAWSVLRRAVGFVVGKPDIRRQGGCRPLWSGWCRSWQQALVPGCGNALAAGIVGLESVLYLQAVHPVLLRNSGAKSANSGLVPHCGKGMARTYFGVSFCKPGTSRAKQDLAGQTGLNGDGISDR